MKAFAALAVALSALSSTVLAVQPVQMRGQNFVNSVTGKRFQIIGVDYQPGGQSGFDPGSGKDPLSNGTDCLRDAALLQQLGVNTIRVYNVDGSINHDECASTFNSVGIYMLVDVNSPLAGGSLDRTNPQGSYTSDYLTRIFQVVENFKNYPNTLAFFAANEVMNSLATAKDPPPYIRAVTRDLKNYIKNHVSRTIPVGYSAADVREILQDSWNYFQCAINGDKDDMTRSDFFGLNSYSWCGNSSYEASSYDTLVDMFGNSSIPVFFSEYGCNQINGQVIPRDFTEVPVLYGPQMTVLSGGLVYEYSQDPAGFGLVSLPENDTAQLLHDYGTLQEQYNKLDINLIESTNSTGIAQNPPTCSSALITNTAFANTFNIPSPPSGGNDLIQNGIKNPTQGKLVQISQTAVPQAVYGIDGQQMKNLAIKPLASDAANTPGGQNSNPSATSSAPSGTAAASPTKAAEAGRTTLTLGSLVFTALVVALLL